jgi:hypothetical protein
MALFITHIQLSAGSTTNEPLYAPDDVCAIFGELAGIHADRASIYVPVKAQVFCNRADILLDGGPATSLNSAFKLVVRPPALAQVPSSGAWLG